MKILQLIAVAALSVASFASQASWSEKYSTEKVTQYVFDTKAGYQYQMSLKKEELVSICSVSLNDGVGSFSFLLFPGTEAQFDVIAEDLEYDGNYTQTHKITCRSYKEHHAFTASEVEQLKSNQVRMEKALDPSDTSIESSDEDFKLFLMPKVSWQVYMELDVRGQDVGSIMELNNRSTEYAYVCKMVTSNSSTPLYILALPDSVSTFHVLARRDGRFAPVMESCLPIKVASELDMETIEYVYHD